MATTSNRSLPLQRFIETLQTLSRTRWLDRLRHHHPHQPTRAFVEDFIRVSTRLLAYIRRHRLIPDSSISPSAMHQQTPRSNREGLHVRRVHREQLFAMLVRLHQYIDTLRRIVRHGIRQHQMNHPDQQHPFSNDDHRRCIDVLHVFTSFQVNSGRR